jgi:hypothetical protein
MQDALAQLSTFKDIALESGATHFTAYNIITGPLFPGLAVYGVFEDLAAFGAAREKVLQRPEGISLLGENSPIEIVNARLAEPVYRAGPPLRDILGQTQVRYSIILRPHRGRGEDVVRRLSRLADTAHQCGALAVAVRRVIAGTEGPRMSITAYHAGFAELEATRAAVMESDFWQALSRSQDEAAVRLQTVITTKIDL